MNTKILIMFFVGLALLSSFSATANSSAAKSNSKFSGEELKTFAKRIEKTLAKKGARVFLIGRIGRPADELPEGIRYTHTALGVYSMIDVGEGRTVPGYAIYNLYQKAEQPNVSELVTDFPVDFFSSAEQLEAGIVIPTPEIQERLLKVIGSKTYQQLHVPQYSAIANPYTLTYQNCTEHTLDVINAAIYQTNDIQQIKANTKAYFEPQEVRVSGLKLVLGSLFMPDVTITDHESKVVTTTFTTIANYLEKYGLVQERLVLRSEI